MPWGSLSGAQQILVRLYMSGGPQYEAQMIKAGLATKSMSRDTKALDAAMAGATKRTWMMSQALFTARRFIFYGTLGVLGLVASVFKMGFAFNSTMQTATVAFQGFIKSPKAVKRELGDLYTIAAKTPFQFPDIVTGARRLLPFTSGLKETNDVLGDVTNSLAAMGITTGAALTRATLALSHMFDIGRLTGQVLYQLGRDNIPMQKALEARFHATGLQIKTAVTKGLIDATTAAKALHQYMQSHPGFATAALRQSTSTLVGSWSTFQDLIREAAGSSTLHVFDSVTKLLGNIDRALIPLVEKHEPLTLTRIAQVIDQQLTPNSHALLNTFVFLQGFVVGLAGTFIFLAKAVSLLLWPFNKIANAFGFLQGASKTLGIVVGGLTALFFIQEGAVLAAKEAALVYRASLWLVKIALQAVTAAQKDQIAVIGSKGIFGALSRSISAWMKWAFAMKVVERSAVWSKDGFKAVKDFERSGIIARLTRALFGLFVAEEAVAAGEVSIEAIALWPIALVAAIIAAVGILVVLYYKWKWFHDLVNRTYKWIMQNANKLALGLIMAFGPLGAIPASLILILKYFNDIKSVINTLVGWINSVANALDSVNNKINRLKNIIPPWMRGAISTAANVGSAVTGVPLTPSQAVARAPVIGPIITNPHESFGHYAVGQIPYVGAARSAYNAVSGIFDQGGTVPGPVGTPQLIMAHGGETVNPVGGFGNMMNGNDRPVHVQVMLDRKVLAEAVARANQDYAARR